MAKHDKTKQVVAKAAVLQALLEYVRIDGIMTVNATVMKHEGLVANQAVAAWLADIGIGSQLLGAHLQRATRLDLGEHVFVLDMRDIKDAVGAVGLEMLKAQAKPVQTLAAVIKADKITRAEQSEAEIRLEKIFKQSHGYGPKHPSR